MAMAAKGSRRKGSAKTTGERIRGDKGGAKENKGINLINVQPPHLAGLHEAVHEALQKKGWPS